MTIALTDFVLLAMVFFCIAFLYSSVGFGGGSSYLAVLAIFLTSFFSIRSTALICNLVVVSGSCILFYKAGHFNLRKFLPFVITSIPMAFLGAFFRLKEQLFFIILGITLLLVAIALVIQTMNLKSHIDLREYPKWFSYGIGGAVGFLSGLVGIGGGIFLAPVLNYLKWDKPIQIAALASFFILVNSISGVFGLVAGGTFQVFWPEIVVLIIVVAIGGQLGVRLTLFKIPPKGLRLVTAFLIFFIGIRVVVSNGLQIQFFQ